MPRRIHPFICCLFIALMPLAGCKSGSSSTKPGSGGLDPDRLNATPEGRAFVLLSEGEYLKKEGFTAQALKAFTKAVEENPQLTEAHLGIGDIYRERAVYDLADKAYRRAVVSDPNNFDARYYLGLTNQLQGKLRQAIASYERALRINPKSHIANRDMASAYLQSGQPGEAIRYAKRAVEADPESQAGWANLAVAYSLTGDYENAVEAYRQTLELGQPAKPVLLGLADAHIKLGNYQRAENVLRAVERSGGDPIARERMGLVLFKQRKFEEAVEAYRAVLGDNPNDTAALNGMGVSMMAIYLRDGEENDELRMEALSLWRRSYNIRPQSSLINLISRYTEE